MTFCVKYSEPAGLLLLLLLLYSWLMGDSEWSLLNTVAAWQMMLIHDILIARIAKFTWMLDHS